MNIVVGSKNPVKLEAVKEAFKVVFPDEQYSVHGIAVSSGVSNQPMTDTETIQGATIRARRALESISADYGVGLEGGLQEISGHWFDCGWAVIINKKGDIGIGSTIRLEISLKMLQLIQSGKELSEVNDMLFGRENSKHQEGHFGLMTNNAITRTQGYRDGVISALSHFIHPEVFD